MKNAHSNCLLNKTIKPIKTLSNSHLNKAINQMKALTGLSEYVQMTTEWNILDSKELLTPQLENKMPPFSLIFE